jgi:hypothetical protein
MMTREVPGVNVLAHSSARDGAGGAVARSGAVLPYPP